MGAPKLSGHCIALAPPPRTWPQEQWGPGEDAEFCIGLQVLDVSSSAFSRVVMEVETNLVQDDVPV